MMNRLCRLVLPAVCAVSSLAAQPTSPLRDSIEARSRAFLATSRTPGLAVGVWKDGKVVFAGGFGVMAVGGQPVTSRTVFHMASISKTFVATAIMQLVEQGKVRIDEPLVKYLPTFRLKDARSSSITVRQVMSHTAGFPDVTDYGWDKPEYDATALERYVVALKDSAMIGAPGEKWEYSNIGFEVLAHLVAKVSGESFEDYVQKHILTPTGMVHSTFLMTDVDSANLATGYEFDRGVAVKQGYPYNRVHAGSSTMHSNVDDMLRYGAMHAQRGMLDGKRILQSQSYDALWKAEKDLAQPFAGRLLQSRMLTRRPILKAEMGLGWFLLDFSGVQVVNHDGGDDGFRSALFIAPDHRTVVVVFVNSGANVLNLALPLLDLALSAPAER